MITLKKSFELQNYLKGLYEDAIMILGRTELMTTTTQYHYRNKAYESASDETVVKPKPCEYTFTPNELIEFTEYLLRNMETLTHSINYAKSDVFDGLIAVNGIKRKMLNGLIRLSGIRAKENMTIGTAFKFNADGEQTPYTYDLKEVTTIDFDRNEVKAIITRLRKELDETSERIDNMQLNTNVVFDNEFEIGESLEDAIERWKSSKDANG